MVGDYRSLPRRYLPEDYLRDVDSFNVSRIICAEFLSTDPICEAQWLQELSDQGRYPNGIIALVDFLSPDIERVLATYASLGSVRVVRQHLAWHPSDPLMRSAARPDVLVDKAWQERLALLSKYNLCCEIEILAPQLPDLTAVASSYPDIQFILPLIGWPINLTEAGRRDWKRDIEVLSSCENVAVKIFGMECIFGLDWTVDQIRPWILDTIQYFKPERCMFASHMPITKLACSFQDLYDAYLDVVSEFSAAEKRKLFHDTATMIYGFPKPDHYPSAET